MKHGNNLPFLFCDLLLSSNYGLIFWLAKCCGKEVPTVFLGFRVCLVYVKDIMMDKIGANWVLVIGYPSDGGKR